MDNLYVKNMVLAIDRKFYCVGVDWTLNRVVSFLIENDIPACPVTKANTKKNVIRQIEGYAVLKELALKIKEYGENPISDFMNDSEWELSDNQYIVDKISVLYRKPVFTIKNNNNQYYATIFQEDVTWYLYYVSSRFMLLRAIENKLTGFIYSHDQNESIYQLPLGKKIEKLFSDDIWSLTKIGFDKSRLHEILNKCSSIRNDFLHFRESDVDADFLKNSWNIIKKELKYVAPKDTKIQDVTIPLNFDEYLHENPQIVKNLLDKNPSMIVSEAKTQAKNIWKNYCEKYKERDDKREVEHNRRWNEALKMESYNTLFEYADSYGSDD